MKRFLWLGWVAFLLLIWTGCGDVFRPIIIPNPPTFPNPRAAHTVLTVNDNGSISHGSALVVDVSGDSEVSVADVGVTPVHAVQQSANQVLVVNTAVTGLNVPTTTCLVTINNQDLNVCPSLTKLAFSSTVIGSTSTISLPIYSGANFVALAPSDTTAYVTLPTYPPDPTHPQTIVPSVGVVNTQSNTMVATIPVQTNPFALAVTPDKSKLYVACDPLTPGVCSMTAFNTLDRSSRAINGTLSSAPIWLSVRSDSQRVFVLEANGTLAWLDTTSTAGPDTLAETSVSVPGATTMVYDGLLNRLYIPGGIPGGPQLAIVDASQSAPQLLKMVPIPPFTLLNLPSVDATAAAVAALPDGSRAYAASYAVLPSDFTVSAVSGDGTTATYAYTLTAGHDLTPGVAVTVTGTGSEFDGTFLVSGIVSGTAACPGKCFLVPNATTSAGAAGSGTASNIFPQVTVVDTSSNTIKTTAAINGFPDATDPSSIFFVPICATTRFRFSMGAGGDSSRAYLASCDGGGIDVIDTSTDSFLVNLPAPFSARPPIPPSVQQPPQNPVFLIAGP